jgi:hypothetical protein
VPRLITRHAFQYLPKLSEAGTRFSVFGVGIDVNKHARKRSTEQTASWLHQKFAPMRGIRFGQLRITCWCYQDLA